MIVLGIDPGTAAMGYGIVERTGGSLRAVDYGCVTTSPDLPLGERLLHIHNELTELIETHSPDLIGVERLFFSKNAQSAFGVGQARIMVRHIFPNVAHLMLIVTVLDFGSLILYEAVLTYVGVGVDPSMNSFGGMINLARNEMSREPLVWWSFAAAFGFMVTLVLAANLFADGVRDAFDPRSRSFRPRRRVRVAEAGPGPGPGAAATGSAEAAR